MLGEQLVKIRSASSARSLRTSARPYAYCSDGSDGSFGSAAQQLRRSGVVAGVERRQRQHAARRRRSPGCCSSAARERRHRLLVLLRVEVGHAERVLHLGKRGIDRGRRSNSSAARANRPACACMMPRLSTSARARRRLAPASSVRSRGGQVLEPGRSWRQAACLAPGPPACRRDTSRAARGRFRRCSRTAAGLRRTHAQLGVLPLSRSAVAS